VVTLFLQPASAYDGGKQMANQMVAAVKGSAMTPASVGDDAYFFVTADQAGLLVKKGASSFKVTVYAKLPVDKKEAMELTLAKAVASKI
jgi:predicted peroxiredoxin